MFAGAAGFLQFLQHCIKRKAARFLPRREGDVGLQVLGHETLRRHEQEHFVILDLDALCAPVLSSERAAST